MKKNLVLIIAGILVLIVVVGVLVGAKILRKIGTKLGGTPLPTASTQNGKYNPATETVSGDITLSVNAPTNGSTTTKSDIEVSGKTSANAEVFVNDLETTADANGNFKTTVTLDEGENTITVSANDSNGNYAEKDITVTYEVPAQ
ncbi:MAG TPA: hypothetical protein VF185_01710 [Patescibacteria group bacterium]